MRTANCTIKNGTMPLTTRESGLSNVYDEINRSMPTGGVKNPIDRFIKNMTAALTALTPKDSASGSKSGETMSIAENISMRQPTTSRTRFINIKNTYGFFTYCVIKPDRIAGTFASSIK